MNTMKDLKREVLERLQHLDGRYFESISTVSIEQMLDIQGMEQTYHPDVIDGSLLDQDHEFWEEYVREIHSEKQIVEECGIAIKLLKEEEKFRMIDPEDDELTGTSIKVKPVSNETQNFDIELMETCEGVELRIKTTDCVYGTPLRRLR